MALFLNYPSAQKFRARGRCRETSGVRLMNQEAYECCFFATRVWGQSVRISPSAGMQTESPAANR